VWAAPRRTHPRSCHSGWARISACCFTSSSEMQLSGSSAQDGPVPLTPAVHRKRSHVLCGESSESYVHCQREQQLLLARTPRCAGCLPAPGRPGAAHEGTGSETACSTDRDWLTHIQPIGGVRASELSRADDRCGVSSSRRSASSAMVTGSLASSESESEPPRATAVEYCPV
jgi:hypothetical protein